MFLNFWVLKLFQNMLFVFIYCSFCGDFIYWMIPLLFRFPLCNGIVLGVMMQAQDFRQQGTTMRRKMWLQNMKVKLIVLAIVIALILIIVLSICGGFKCTWDPHASSRTSQGLEYYRCSLSTYIPILLTDSSFYFSLYL